MKKNTITGLLAAGLALALSLPLSAQSADLDAIKARGVLKVGVKVDVPKFGYKDAATGKVDGFEIDLARILAGKILGDPSKIDVQGVTAKTRGPLLDNGEIDLVIATFTITEERKKSYNFSVPYFTDGVGVLIKTAKGFKSIKDLNGKRIGVAQSATTKKALQEYGEANGLKFEFAEFNSYPEIKAALDSGRVDAFSVDGAILAGYKDASTSYLPDRFSPQDYGIASKLGNQGLAKLVDDTVKALLASGELDKLVAKWELK